MFHFITYMLLSTPTARENVLYTLNESRRTHGHIEEHRYFPCTVNGPPIRITPRDYVINLNSNIPTTEEEGNIDNQLMNSSEGRPKGLSATHNKAVVQLTLFARDLSALDNTRAVHSNGYSPNDHAYTVVQRYQANISGGKRLQFA